MKKKSKIQMILQGAENKSAFMIYRNEELVPEESYHIEKYTVMYWSGNEDGLPMVATEETEHKIAISLKGSRKVLGAATCGFEAGENAGKPQALKGLLTVIWINPEEGLIGFLWIDGKKKDYKNISLDTYGYEAEECYELLKAVFQRLIAKLPEKVQGDIVRLSEDKPIFEPPRITYEK